MNILFNKFQNIYFGARNKDIRRADDIQRKACGFNFISSSRIDDSCEDSNNIEYKEKAKYISDKLKPVILTARYAADMLNETNTGIGILYADDLDLATHTGLGNCMEYAKAGIAALCANGFYNNERVNLRYEVEFINKYTGESEYKNEESLDHSFVLTDMNCRDEKDIVVDPWLGFADYKTEALVKFKNLFEDKIKIFKRDSEKLFRIHKLKNGEEYNPEDYKIRADFVFVPREIYTTSYQKEQLGDYARTIYPELVLNKKAQVACTY